MASALGKYWSGLWRLTTSKTTQYILVKVYHVGVEANESNHSVKFC